MTAKRLEAICLIFLCTAAGWTVLRESIVVRTGSSDGALSTQVEKLWGGHHRQLAPDAWIERNDTDPAATDATRKKPERVTAPLTSSRIQVDLDLEPRRKGLLWYDTYSVGFAGHYRAKNPDTVERELSVRFAFPSTQAIYDGFRFEVNGVAAAAVSDLGSGVVVRQTLAPGAEADIDVAYRSRGLGEWRYELARTGVSQVDDFHLAMSTNFDAIDFPSGSLSPTSKKTSASGWALAWDFQSLVSGQSVGMSPPLRLNPGPLAARITYFAPVSLLFFFSVLVILGLVRGQSLHPMNYFFLAAAFFAFHLLLAYLADVVDIHVAFTIAATTSVVLVVSYLRIVGGARFALLEAGLAQLVYLVLFSYAFFFEGHAGLTITLGAVVTLFVLMQTTAQVDWGDLFERGERPRSRPIGRVAPATGGVTPG